MTPDEIAREAVDAWWNHSAVPNMDSLVTAIAAAIRAERERAERAEASLAAFKAAENVEWMKSETIDKLQDLAERTQAAEAERDRLRALVEECAPYLKDGETPIQRIERDFKDSQALLAMLAKDRAERDRLRDALEPFARAGELFVRNPMPEGSVMMIYGPAAGDGYSLNSDHLVAAHAALRKTDSLPVGGDPVNAERT